MYDRSHCPSAFAARSSDLLLTAILVAVALSVPRLQVKTEGGKIPMLLLKCTENFYNAGTVNEKRH